MIKEKCFHCGLDVKNEREYVIILDKRTYSLCCQGCLAVTKFILDNGFKNYYDNRHTYGNKIDETFFTNSFNIYDDFKNLEKFSKKKKI